MWFTVIGAVTFILFGLSLTFAPGIPEPVIGWAFFATAAALIFSPRK